MYFFTIILNWIISDARRKSTRKNALRRRILLKSQTESTDEINNDHSAVFYRVIKMWSYFILFLLAWVLLNKNYKKKDFHQNFMSNLCRTGDKGCDHIVMKAILIHLITTLALLIASRTVRSKCICYLFFKTNDTIFAENFHIYVALAADQCLGHFSSLGSITFGILPL